MGPYLSSPITTKNVTNQSNSELKYTTCQMQGWRKTMQDSKISKINIAGGISIFGVFDGHGGIKLKYFRILSFKVRRKFLKNQNFKNKEYQKALIQTFKEIDKLIDSKFGNQQLREIRKNSDQHTTNNADDQSISSSTGCTANVLLITPNHYYVANAGDSRSVLSRNGKAIALSQDHKPQNETEKNRIIKAGGAIIGGRVNGGLNLSRSFGDFGYKRETGIGLDQQLIISKPDIVCIPRSKDDEFIIMGCDGIWQKYVSNNQGMVQKILNQKKNNKDIERILPQLLDFLLAKQTTEQMGCDNMTGILIEFIKC